MRDEMIYTDLECVPCVVACFRVSGMVCILTAIVVAPDFPPHK